MPADELCDRELSPDRFKELAINQNGPDIAGCRGRSLPTLEVVRVDKRDRPSNESTARPCVATGNRS